MKAVSLLAVLGAFASTAIAANDYQTAWTRTLGSTNSVGYTKMAVDAAGNCYVAADVFTSALDGYVVVQKFNAQGDLQWQTTAQGDSPTARDFVVGLQLDSSGNPYLCAHLVELYNFQNRDYTHLVRLDPMSGAVVWSAPFSTRIPTDLKVMGNGDSSSRVYVAGLAKTWNGVPYGHVVSYIASTGATSVQYNVDTGVVKPSFALAAGCSKSGFVGLAYQRPSGAGVAFCFPDGWWAGQTATEFPNTTFTGSQFVQLKPSGYMGFATQFKTGSATGILFMRASGPGAGQLYYQKQIMLENASVIGGLIALPNDGMATTAGRTVGGIQTTELLTASATGVITMKRLYTPQGVGQPLDLGQDPTGVIHVVQSLQEPSGSPALAQLLADASPLREDRYTGASAESIAIACDAQGSIFTAGYRVAPNGFRVAMLRKIIPVPRVVSDFYDVDSGRLTTVAAPGVLANDFGRFGGTASLSTQASHGTVSLDVDGGFTYQSDPGYSGMDTFVYTLNTQNQNLPCLVNLRVHGAKLSSLTLAASALIGGSLSSGTVRISEVDATGPTVITMSDDVTGIAVPTTVTIPKGLVQNTFWVSTAPLDTTQVGTITATLRTITKTATLTVLPPVLTSLTLNPTTVKGGAGFGGTVVMASKVYLNGTYVGLSADSPNVIIHTVMFIPGGKTAGTFNRERTKPVLVTETCTISATYFGSVKTATLTITP